MLSLESIRTAIESGRLPSLTELMRGSTGTPFSVSRTSPGTAPGGTVSTSWRWGNRASGASETDSRAAPAAGDATASAATIPPISASFLMPTRTGRPAGRSPGG